MADPTPQTVLQPLDRFQAESIDLDLVAADAARESLRLIELRAAKADVRQLQGSLADAHQRLETLESALRTWAPLLAQYEHEQAGQRAARFVVVPLDQWITDIIRSRRGVVVDDGAGADWLRRQ